MILYVILGILAAFLAVILIRAIRFKPAEDERAVPDPLPFDRQKAVDDLQALVRCRTVSSKDLSAVDEAEFEKLRALLPGMFPNLFRVCEYVRTDRTGIILRWPGTGNGDPSVFMAHYDVVPVNMDGWERDPFAGEIVDGELWGRGTLDTKITFCASMEAGEALVKSGFVPENDIYFCYAGDEEVFGVGAQANVAYMENKGLKPALVVDEGGAVVEDVFPGVTGRCAMVGIGEKGMLDARFTMKSKGGHASAPPVHGPVGMLSKAVWDVETHPFPVKLSEPVARMYDTLGRRSTFLYRLIFANLWCFLPVLDLLCKKKGGEMNALMRTTCAFTQMSGSEAVNVLPPEASVTANLRIIGGETVQSALDYLNKTVDNPDIEITVLDGQDPSITSDVDSDAWRKIKKAIEQTWTDAAVTPYVMLQCSDSRHFCRISDKVMRFSAMELTSAQRALIHGNNERIPVEKIGEAVDFYINLERQC